MKENYICENIFVPLRSAPSHKSEMLSQVLFGEKYTITGKAGKWIKVLTGFDNYTGWLDMDHRQHSETDNADKAYVINRYVVCFKDDDTRLVLEPGSEIFNPDFEQKTFTAGNSIYRANDEFSSSAINSKDSLPDIAMRFINTPYIWGGRIPSGIDCSGLTQLAYKIHGITIPRDSWQQAEVGEQVTFIGEGRAGDLVFFDNDLGKISHVGMLIATGLVIHASGRVRIDTIDHQGIFKPEIGGYSHRLRLIKRILG